MIGFFRVFKRLADQLHGENLHRVILTLLVLILLGSVAFSFFEKDLGFLDSLWWSIVTVTTVGYGDISPATLGGRIVGVALMMMGIGFIGILTATIAGIFIEEKLMDSKGMKTPDVDGHFLICGWNWRGEDLVAELKSDEKGRGIPIVVIAELDEKPLHMDGFHFIHGEVTDEVLEKARAGKAQTAIMLRDEKLDPRVGDAKTILDTLTIKTLYPDLYTCVELSDGKNVAHCERAMADEIIVVGELGSNLLAQAALDHGLTRMITELVSNRFGNELYKIDAPPSVVGREFLEVMTELKKDRGILCLGVENRSRRKLTANPAADYRIGPDDQLVVIAADRPTGL